MMSSQHPEKLIFGHLDYQNSSESEKEYLVDLAINGQKPHTLFIGCCDSRVIPEQFTNSKPGELFVLRNIANHVPKYEEKVVSVGSAITYAVKYLKVQHIVVCGHTSCGGVLASNDLQNIDDYSLKTWVSNLKSTVEDNALYSMNNLKTYPLIQELIDKNQINLHAWIYDIETISLNVWNGSTWISTSQIMNV